jgi:hypothetical protein
MTSEFPDSYNDSTGLSTTGQAKLVDTVFDHWQDLAEAMRIPWMGDQLLAIASITAECLQRVDSIECAMPDITGEESAGTDDVAAEVQHDDSDVGAAPADVSMGSQDPPAAPADQGSDVCVQCPKCSTGFTGNQPKVNLCIHINSGCLEKSGPFSEAEKARLRALDLADCKKCGKWMARRSVNSQRHKKVCKNDRRQPDDAASDGDDGSMPPKPGRYGVYGDSPPLGLRCS